MKKRDRKRTRTSKSKKQMQTKDIKKTVSKKETASVLIIEEPSVVIPSMYDEEAYKYKYVVATKYNDVSTIIYATDNYQDAISKCIKDYNIYVDEGIKVYPKPELQLYGNDRYTVKCKESVVKGSYKELSAAIRCCGINDNVYDPNGNKVY